MLLCVQTQRFAERWLMRVAVLEKEEIRWRQIELQSYDLNLHDDNLYSEEVGFLE